MVLDLGTVNLLNFRTVRACGFQGVSLCEIGKMPLNYPTSKEGSSLARLNGATRRFMWTGFRNTVKRAAATGCPTGQRNMGHYRPVNIPHSTVAGNGKKLPHNDYTHTHVQNTKTGEIVGKFTTTPNAHFKSTVISSTEYADGTLVLTGEAGQHFAYSPKRIEAGEGDTKPVVHPVNKPEAQTFLDKYEGPIDVAVATSEKNDPQNPKMIVNKNNSILFHENGTKDSIENSASTPTKNSSKSKLTSTTALQPANNAITPKPELKNENSSNLIKPPSTNDNNEF